MDKKIKIALISVLAIFVAAIAFGVIYAIWEQTAEIKTKYDNLSDVIEGEGLAKDGDYTLSKYYVCESNISEMYTIFLTFDEEGTYHFGVSTSDTATGSYVQNGNLVTIDYNVNGSTTSEVSQMLIIGDRICYNTAVCCGDEIPETGLFNATVSRLSSDGTAYQYTFHDDGSYELLYGKRGRTNWHEVEGHYSRNDDGSISRTLITVTTGEENETLPFLVYEGHLIDSIYEAITEEEYNAMIAGATEESSTEE